MPSHRVHCYYDRVMFGKSYPKIHRRIDEAYIYFKRGHRELFHDPITAVAIAEEEYPGDPNAILAALGHLYLDEVCSSNPDFKRYLESCARRSRKKRKLKPKDTIEDPFIQDLEKMAELKRLYREFYSNK